MHRIDTTNKAVDLFGSGKHGWRDGNKALGINATEFNAAMMNMIQEELAALPEGVGMTLDANNRTQVREAIKRMIDAQAGNYALDTGAADAYVVALDPAITAYEGGMTVRVKAVNANTGASTLNAGGGAVALVNDAGGALAAGDIAAGSIFTATYIASANKFYITSMVQSQGDARYAQLSQVDYVVGSATRDISLASGTQDITGLPFTPKAVTVYAADQNTRIESHGHSDGTTDGCMFDSPSPPGTYGIIAGAAAISLRPTATDYVNGKISFISGGIRITWTKNGSPTGNCYILFKAER